MAKASKPNSAEELPASPLTFEAALQELESIVQSMESGAAPLEESLANYACGIALLRQCQETLATAEKKIQILENGVLRDFDAATEGGPEG
jgi:exodeoxyribonuclease VII small subunit